jgi:hypothetical protein
MKKYKLNLGFITQKIDDQYTIFSGEDSILHSLNDTAAYIFQGIKLGWNESKIIDGLVLKFNATPNQAKQDLVEFTELLLKKNIISEVK